MYFSQTAIVMVLLVFLTSTIYYQTVEYRTNNVENSMEIKKIALYEHNLENTLNRTVSKIVEDAFVNRSYEIMCGDRNFYSSSENAVNDIDAYILNETNKTLYVLSDKNSTISYSIDYVNISPVYNKGEDSPFYIDVHYKIYINYSKKLKNGYVVASKPIYLDKEVKISRIPDPYVYKNNFYWTWHNEVTITMNPNEFLDDKNHTFCIILNSSNFNYNLMYNDSSPREIRVIGKKSGGTDNDLILLPYWVQTWNEGVDNTSIIWVKCNIDNLIGGKYLYILYNSTTLQDRENPYNTFKLFDDFNYLDYGVWNVSGGWYINDSRLIVQGLGSSIWTNKTYGTGLELMFSGNFTPIHAQAVGFFTPKSDNDGVGWDCYNYSDNWLYMRNGSSGKYVNNGTDYLNKYYIYDLKRNTTNLNFSILDDTNHILYNWSSTSDNSNNYSISINTFTNSNATVSIDWIFLKDINNIKPVKISGNQLIPQSNSYYKELKPKTYKQTIYYGEPEQYVYVDYLTNANAGNYSIIGLLTNATDSWGLCGYEPKIELE